MNDKLKAAMQYLGDKWVLHPRSSYNPEYRKYKGSVLLAAVAADAVTKGHLEVCPTPSVTVTTRSYGVS